MRTHVRVPAALLALPLLAGASAGYLLHGSCPERWILAAAGGAALCAVAGLGFFLDQLNAAVAPCVMAGAALAGYALGGSATRELIQPPLLVWFESLPAAAEGPYVIEGVLRDDAAQVPYGVLLNVDVHAVGTPASAHRTSGGARLVVGGRASHAFKSWRAGRTIRAPASLRRPMTFANPGVPDEQRAQALRGIALTGSIKSGALIEVVAPGGWLSECAASVRAWTRRVIDMHVGPLDERSAAVAIAILIGDRTGLSDEDERRLQDAGTYHVIAISGGNIAILTALLIAVARLTRLPPRVAAALAIGILLFYGEVAGGSASVRRAVTAAAVFLAARGLDQRGPALNVVAVAAALAIAAQPVTPADAGFLLSFGATIGILLGAPRFAVLLARDGQNAAGVSRRLLRAVFSLFVATLCAEIALAPVAATVFSRVTLAGLVVNFAAIPLMTVVQCGSMALLVAHPISRTAAEMLARLAHGSAWGLVESARLVDVAPWLARDVAAPAIWLLAVYYSCCLVAIFVPRLRRPALGLLLVVATTIWLGIGGARAEVPSTPGVLRVAVLDVGQGDATLVVLPDGQAVLVDAGGMAGTTFDIGRRVVLPALRAFGVHRLHALVLTHGDPDHIGGAAAVLDTLPVGNVWEGIPVPPHEPLRAIRAIASARGVVWRTVRPGAVENAAGVEIRVLHPPEPDWERQRVRNDDSTVVELRYGDVSILLPGDIGREGEQAVLPLLSLGRTVVLKAAHHGSATSSSDDFLDASRPGVVIFSAGRNNYFGHPAPVVVHRFVRRGVPMFNTANDGAVLVETDGRRVTVRGWQSGRELEIEQPEEDK